MSSEKQKVQVPGLGEVTGQKVGLKATTDEFVELEDGTRIKFKAVLVDAIRTDEYETNGNPKYIFQFGLAMVSIEVPEELKRKEDGGDGSKQ